MRIRCNIIRGDLLFQILEQEAEWYDDIVRAYRIVTPFEANKFVEVGSSMCPQLGLSSNDPIRLKVWLRGEVGSLDSRITGVDFQNPGLAPLTHNRLIVLQRSVIAALVAQSRRLNCPFELEG